LLNLTATDWSKSMPGSTQLVPRSEPKPSKIHTRIKQQIDLHSLALEVQTLSLILSDLRDRISQLEKKSSSDKITGADRALLSNLDRVFKKASSSPLLLPGKLEDEGDRVMMRTTGLPHR
jgi:hypothetical protein